MSLLIQSRDMILLLMTISRWRLLPEHAPACKPLSFCTASTCSISQAVTVPALRSWQTPLLQPLWCSPVQTRVPHQSSSSIRAWGTYML